MDHVNSRGYLQEKFKLFHLCDAVSLSEIESHYHSFHKLIFVESGNVAYTVEGKHYSLGANDIVLIPLGCIHRPESSGSQPYGRYVLFLDSTFLREVGSTPIDLCFSLAAEQHNHVFRMKPEQSSSFLQRLREIETVCLDDDSYASAMLSELLVKCMMIELCRAVLQGTGASPVKYDKKISAIIAYISEELIGDLSIDSIAEKFFISKYHLMRRFREETGYSLHRYICDKRLLFARELIADGHSATEACYLCGYKDYSAFARAYKKQFSHSPKIH